MGIRGLSTYIDENSKQFLKPYKLCDTYLIVDGNNVASHLYTWVSKSDSIFGGDYDEFYKTVKDFFNNLKKCQVIPIVLFDGGYEKKKLKTVMSRAATKMITLRSFAKNFSSVKFFPLFHTVTFVQVMEDLNIFCFQCEFEADIEIAAVARALGCPVLSYDSDFYIYDVMYIPFSTVCNELVKLEDSSNKAKFYIDCLIYDVNNLLEHFKGLDKSLLPIAATLLGNDYVESSVFQKFFNHLSMPKSKSLSYNQRKIYGVFEWLKNENVESATKLILNHLQSKVAATATHAINRSIKEYTKISVSPSLFDKLIKILKNKNVCKLEKVDCQTCLPTAISENFCQCKISKFIVDMIVLKTYFSPLQVEYVHQQSSHFQSFDLIKAIYKIIISLSNENFKSLKLYIANKNFYTAILLEEENFLSEFNLKNILNEPTEVRLILLYKTLMLNEEEINTVKNFKGSWITFVICFLYWLRKLNNSISVAHIHALILMSVCNEVVQKKVGYYRNSSKFLKKKGSLLRELSNYEVMINQEEDLNFEEQLEKVTLYECLKLQQILIEFRKNTESKKKDFYISTIHLFACFQSCLYHLMQLNAVLNFPLPHLRINDYYSGTLLYNFYNKISQKSPVEKFENTLLQDFPNIARVNKFLVENLSKFSVKKNTVIKETKRKKKINKRKEINKDDNNFKNPVSHISDESDYNDENNAYALLRRIN